MTFKPAIWYPIAVGLSAFNLVGVWFATGPAHTTVHAVLALAFGLWAQRLRPRRDAEGGELRAGLEALQVEVSKLRVELTEAQERLDFAERLLAQGSERGRVGPQR